jgi:hypothetical protein
MIGGQPKAAAKPHVVVKDKLDGRDFGNGIRSRNGISRNGHGMS